jgi:hypothetical protein
MHSIKKWMESEVDGPFSLHGSQEFVCPLHLSAWRGDGRKGFGDRIPKTWQIPTREGPGKLRPRANRGARGVGDGRGGLNRGDLALRSVGWVEIRPI